MAVAGLLQPLVKELTNVQDPLTCLSALSLLKEQVEQTSSSRLQSLLANFFLPHLEQLLRQADSIVKPMAMQAGIFVRLSRLGCHLRLRILSGSLALDAICACAIAMHGCNMLECTLLLARRLLCTQGSTLLHLCVDLCSCTSWNRPYHYMLSAGVLCGVHLVASAYHVKAVGCSCTKMPVTTRETSLCQSGHKLL